MHIVIDDDFLIELDGKSLEQLDEDAKKLAALQCPVRDWHHEKLKRFFIALQYQSRENKEARKK